MKYQLTELAEHPDNNQIYSSTDLEELKNSLLIHGQLEPLVINKNKVIISGHRRFNAMKEIGLTECDARIEEFESDVVALIQFNKQRQKSPVDYINESKFLEKELQKQIGRGRHKKEGQVKMNTRDEVAKILGTNSSQLQKLKFIDKNDSSLLYKIQRKEISIAKAVQEIKDKLGDSKEIDSKTLLRRRLLSVFKDENYSLDDVSSTLRTIYPYSLELTKTSTDKRDELVKELDKLRKMNSRDYMYYRKFDDLEYLKYTKEEQEFAKSLLPTIKELEEWYHSDDSLGLVDVIDCETDMSLNKKMWSICRHYMSSFEYNSGRGRYINFFVTFKTTKDKTKLLGIATLGSDIQGYSARDEHIGWSNEVRAQKREHIVNMRVCIPTQPFGFNFLGGKLISLLMTRAVPIYEKKYKDRVIAIVTTSLHGSFSQYSGMKNWLQLEKTKGEVIVEPKREIYEFWLDWFKQHFPEEYEYSSNLSNIKNYRLMKILSYLGIDIKRYQHSHERGVFICPLYKNYIRFLNEKDTERHLIPEKIDIESWLYKSHKRYSSLKKSKKLKEEKLFIENDDRQLFEAYLKEF